MMADVVTFKVCVDVCFELCVLGFEAIAHIDNGIRFVFESIDEALIESRHALQFPRDVPSSE